MSKLVNSKFYNNIYTTDAAIANYNHIGELIGFDDYNSKFYTTVFVGNNDIGDVSDDIYNSLIDLTHWVAGNPSGNIVSILAFPLHTNLINTEGYLVLNRRERYDFKVHNEPELLRAIYRVAYLKAEPTYTDFRGYSGYTRYRLFLPYYGYVELKPEDIIGKWIQVLLKPDFTTGKAMYIIGVTDISRANSTIGHTPLTDSDLNYYNSNLMRIIETIEFQLGVDLPIGAVNSSEQTRNLILSAANMAFSVAMMGAPIPTQVATSVGSETLKRNIKTKNPATNRMNIKTRIEDTKTNTRTTTYDNSEYIKQRRMSDCFSSGLDVLRSFNYETQKSNPISPYLAGNLPLKVHLIEYTPNYVDPDDEFNRLYGRPLGSTRKLSSLDGYTEISAIHIEGDAFKTATSEEIAMLEEELTSGIFL